MGESNEFDKLAECFEWPCNDVQRYCRAAPDCCSCRLESLLSDYCHNRVLIWHIPRDSLAGAMFRVAVEKFVAHLCYSLALYGSV